MALALATGPALAVGEVTALTSASFTPPAGATLVALVSYISSTSAGSSYSQTVTSSNGLTWTLLARKSSLASSTGGASVTASTGSDIWVATVATSASMTVTTTASSIGSKSLRVMVLTGGAAVQNGVVGAAATTSGLPTVALTGLTAGSHVFAVSSDYNESAGGTVGTGQTAIDNAVITGSHAYHNWRTTAVLTGTSQTMNLTAPSSQDYTMVAAEIKTGAATTSVTVTRAATWNVTVAAVAPAAVTTTRAATWDVRTQILTDTYTDTYADVYAAGSGSSGLTRTVSWDVATPVTAVGLARATAWDTAGPVRLDRATTWGVRTAQQITRAVAQWNTRIRVAADPRTTTWAIFANTSTVASTRPGARLRVYLPNGADQGILPAPLSVSASYPLNDVGALSFDYAVRAPRSGLLGQPCEVAVEYSPDNGLTWVEPDNSRFRYLADGGDPLDPADKFSASAKSYVERLSTAPVLPRNLLNADGKRPFLSASPGLILKTLLNEAQADGFLTGLSHSSFTTTLDSSGAAWATTMTVYYEPGLSYLAILQNLADQGFVDFKTNGRALYVYNADATLAVDRTVGSPQVTLRAGRDLVDAPFRRTWENLANFAFFAGADGATYSFTDVAAYAPWGKQGVFISNGSVTDQGTMAALTQNELASRNGSRTEYTRSLDFTRAVSKPFWDYKVGDYVWSATDGTGAVRLRVRQLTLTVDEHGMVSGNVVLNDRFIEADIRAKRRIEGITNGASSGDGTGGPVPSTESDKVAPGVVTGLSGSSAAFLGPGGFAQAQVTLTWTEPATNVDGTPFEDFDHYEVFQRPFGSLPPSDPNTALRMVASTTDSTWSNSPYVAGSNWWFSAKAVDTSGNRSALSSEISIGMASDTTPPQAPSTPQVTQDLGIVRIYWDGLPVTGSWAADFDLVEVHTSLTNNFTPTAATQYDTLYGEGPAIVTGLAYNVPVYAKLIAVDTAGLKSVPSAQGTATPLQLVNTDLITDIVNARLLAPGAVDSAAIADLAVGTANMIDLAVVNSKIGNLAVNDAKISNLSVGKLTAATLTADILVASRLMTASTGARVEMSGTGIRMYNSSSAITGWWNPAVGQLRIYNSTDATKTSTGHGLQFGDNTGQNLIIDNNEIMSRFNGQYSQVLINREGGQVVLGGVEGDWASDGSNYGQGVSDEAHSVVIRANVRIANTDRGDYADENPPLLIGDLGGQHLWLDNNEVSAANGGDNVGVLHLQSPRVTPSAGGYQHHNEPVVIGSDSLAIRRNGDYNAGDRGCLMYGYDAGADVSLLFAPTGGLVVKARNNTGFKSITASAFTVSSKSSVKEQISDFSPLEMVKKAKSQRWLYRRDVEHEKKWHYGPMLEDLPIDMRRPIGRLNSDDPNSEETEGYDVASLVGILWEAVRLLDQRIDTLIEKVKAAKL